MKKVNPNRMELLAQKKKLAVAKRGHKLLKDKQDALIKLFLEKIHETIKLREEIENELNKAYKSFLIARAIIDTSNNNVIFQKSYVTNELKQSTQNNMGVKSPVYQFSQIGNLHSYGYVGTSGELDISIEIFSGILKKMVKLTEMEKMIELMAYEIEKTRRRVNALEYILIPQTEEIIKYIRMKLDEIERSNLSRLMHIKDIIREE